MGKIIAVINQKGGVGKTATTCHLAYCFAKKNKRTLLVDIDPSANASSIFLGDISPALTIRDFLLNKDVDIRCILSAFQNEESINFLSILPSSIKLALTELQLSTRAFRETLLAKKLRSKHILSKFDYVFIDCPPTLNTLTVNAMYCADFILIPINFQKYALDGLADLFEVLHEIKENHKYSVGILRNQFDGRKKHANNYVADNISELIAQQAVLSTVLRQDEAINRCTLRNQVVFEGCAHTTAATDYNALANELEEILHV